MVPVGLGVQIAPQGWPYLEARRPQSLMFLCSWTSAEVYLEGEGTCSTPLAKARPLHHPADQHLKVEETPWRLLWP